MKSNTLTYLAAKYRLDLRAKSPIEIPNVGRNNLAEWLHDLDSQVGVEVGVAAGEYSEIICNNNPQMKLYGIDLWQPYRGYTDYRKNETFRKLYQQARSRLSKFPKYIFIKEFSQNALKRFADNSLDFVYIDANHEDPFITQDIEGWSQKVKSSGIVSGHDYVSSVKTAVDKYTLDHKIKTWFILGPAKNPSWIWIKP